MYYVHGCIFAIPYVDLEEMSEADTRQAIVKLLKPLDAVSVENVVGPGTPDINYGGTPGKTLKPGWEKWEPLHLEGWIEVKWAKEWPVKPETPFRCEHYTKQQKVWARRRRHRGGNCWLFLQVGIDWILFDGMVAAEHLGHSTRERLIQVAHKHWTTKPTREELIHCLSLMPTPQKSF